ncbi:hypothetical protein Ddc_24280 [Ditylenchus destructor]|nr:hypothetical protein Ddc_24280 [Ditylenchus destructor]
MSHLRVNELRAFIPALDFERSKQSIKSSASRWTGKRASSRTSTSTANAASCCRTSISRLFATNFMMHMVVEDVDAWLQRVHESGVAEKYGVRVGAIESQPWGMRDFVLYDPAGVLWRIGADEE